MNREQFSRHPAQFEQRGMTPEERFNMSLEERRDYEEFESGDVFEQLGLPRKATVSDLKRKAEHDRFEATGGVDGLVARMARRGLIP